MNISNQVENGNNNYIWKLSMVQSFESQKTCNCRVDVSESRVCIYNYTSDYEFKQSYIHDSQCSV